MRAHPVKALNLIQDSTRHRWHEATATKTALGPPATQNRLRTPGLASRWEEPMAQVRPRRYRVYSAPLRW